MTKVVSTVALKVIAKVGYLAAMLAATKVDEMVEEMVEMTDKKKVNEKDVALVRKWDQDSAQKMVFHWDNPKLLHIYPSNKS